MITIQSRNYEDGVPLKGGCSKGTRLCMSDYRVRNAISFLAWSDGSTAHYCVYNPSPHLFISLAIVYQPATDVTGITPHQVLL